MLRSLLRKSNQDSNRIGDKRGFTLVELLVTIAIFVFMTALVLTKYNSFDSGALLTNQAYDVAMAIRETQTYGMSVLTKDMGTSDFSGSYGILFSGANSLDPQRSNSKTFSIYANTVSTGKLFTSTSGHTLIKTYKLSRGTTITKLIVYSPNQPPSFTCSTYHMFVSFSRPNPDAIVSCRLPLQVAPSPYSYALVELSNGSNKREVRIYPNGQITVN